MNTLIPFLTSLLGGMTGGLACGLLLRQFNISFPGNILAGLVGGGFMGQLLGSAGLGSISVTGGHVVSGMVGGVLLVMLIGTIRRKLYSPDR